MKRVLLALGMAGWVAACGDGSSTGKDGDVKGGVTVHTRFWESKASEAAVSAYVMLGDGSRFLQRVGASSDVTFEDSSLEGPQDITLVLNYREDGREYATAYTYVAVNTSDVWLQLTPKDPPAVVRPSVFVSGKVSGFTNSADTFVSVVGTGVSGSARVTSDGSYRLEAKGTLPAVVNLFVLERGTSGPYAKAVGMKKGVNLVEGQQLTGQDLSIDHPVDREMKLTVTGTAPYEQTFWETRLSFYQDKRFIFETTSENLSSSQPATSIPTIAL
ncbi:MAG TPA: hypothetical protein VF815_06710, partial [Myxococcaceae bacterium]